MNWDRIKGNLQQVTGKVKSQCGKVTDDDLVVARQRDPSAGRSRSATASPSEPS